MPNILDQIEKVLLESLETRTDFVNAADLISSLRLKNAMLERIAVDDVSDLANNGLIEVTDGVKIKITPLGIETLRREGLLDQASKRSIMR